MFLDGAYRRFLLLPIVLAPALLGFVLSLPIIASAQQLSIRRYGVSDGLAHSGVRSIHQDEKGYLWFGTNEGISRFDGYRFTNYGMRDGLSNPYINVITEDRDKRIWVGTNGGGVSRFIDDPREALSLSRREPASTAMRKFVSYQVGDSPASNRVNAVLFDPAGNLWCATDGGLFRAVAGSLGDPRFETIIIHRQGYDRGAAFTDSQGRLWFGVADGLIEAVGNRVIKYGPEDEVSQSPVTNVIEDRQGRLLVASHNRLFEYIAPADATSRGKWKRFPLTLKPDQYIRRLLVDSAGTLWVGTGNGLVRYTDGKQTVYTTAQGLTHNDILALYEDRDDNLWIGTDVGGVCKLSGDTIVSFTRAEGLPDQRGQKIIEDRQGRVYVSAPHGLSEIVADRAVPIEGSQSPPFDMIGPRILQDNRGDWWVGTDHGLFRFEGPELQLRRGRKFTTADGISEAPIKLGMCEDSAGRLWISSDDHNLYYCEGGRKGRVVFGRLSLSAGSPFSDVFYTLGDRSGALWMGNHGLLGKLANGKITMLEPADGLPETNPRAFFQDSRGWLWIGLRYRGVSMTKDPAADPLTFVNYSIENGLASDTVWAITEDDSGRVYFGTGKGLDRLDVSTGRIRHFTTSDGLASDEVTDCMKDRRGNIWVATGRGVSKLNPRAEPSSTRPPPVYFTRVDIAGEDLAISETGLARVPELELSASRNNLIIEYVGLDFHGEHGLKYQYMLEGADKDWSAPTDQRSVNYARLAPGSYRFLVRAMNQEGIASVESAAIELRILPPVWQRWWSMTLAAILVGLAIYAAYRYRVRELIALERVRTRIASDLHDDIGASLSRVAILSEVVKRQAGTTPASLPMLTEIADSARGLVGSMRDIVWSIDPRRDDLDSLISRVRQFTNDVLEREGVNCEFELAPQLGGIRLGPDARRHLFLFFKEAINNVGRHAECSSVSLKITLDRSELRAQVRDDGRGFPAPAAEPSAENDNEGHGLKNMRERAAQLGGSLTIHSLPGVGTTLELTVPLKKP